MLVRLLTAALLATLAVADLASISGSIKTVNADWGKVNETLIAFTGFLPTALPIVPAINQLQNDLKSGTTTINASPALTNDEGSTLLTPIDRLILDSRVTLFTFRFRRRAFNTFFGQGIVRQSLIDTRKAHSDWSNALVARLPAALQGNVRTAFAVVDTEFQATIDAYAAPTTSDDFFTIGSSFKREEAEQDAAESQT